MDDSTNVLPTRFEYDDDTQISPLAGGSASAVSRFLTPSSVTVVTPLANAPLDPGEYCIYNVNASSFGYNPNTMGSNVLVYDPNLGIAQYEATAPSPGGDLAGAQLQAYDGTAIAVPIASLDESEVGAVTYSTMVNLAIGGPWWSQIAGAENTNADTALVDAANDDLSWIQMAERTLNNSVYDPDLVAQGWKELQAGVGTACSAVAAGIGAAAISTMADVPPAVVVSQLGMTEAASLQNLARCYADVTQGYQVLPDLAERSALLDGAASLGSAMLAGAYKMTGIGQIINILSPTLNNLIVNSIFYPGQPPSRGQVTGGGSNPLVNTPTSAVRLTGAQLSALTGAALAKQHYAGVGFSTPEQNLFSHPIVHSL